MPLTQAKLESHPLAEFVERAILENRARWTEAKAAGTFLKPSFEFGRILLGHQAFANLDRDQAADLAEAVCPNLWNELPSTTTTGVQIDAVADFLDSWDAIKCAEGAESQLKKRIRQARAEAVESPPKPNRYGGRFSHTRYDDFCLFVRFLECLQDNFGHEPMPIPQGVVAEVWGCDQTQVSRWVRAACRDGLLTRTTKANWKKRRCAEYRFDAYQIRKSGSPEVLKSASPKIREPRESESPLVHLDEGRV